jgi:alkylhydroperoxidase family enzyme
LNKDSNAFKKEERETVASYVSFLNKCNFCYKSHSAVADYLWSSNGKTKEIITKIENENFSCDSKIERLLHITKKLHACPQGLSQEDINLLYNFDFTSNDINDLILIISSFCMFNRYVDGLGTSNSLNDEMYSVMGEKIAINGYK